jgi:hypothetical protein
MLASNTPPARARKVFHPHEKGIETDDVGLGVMEIALT